MPMSQNDIPIGGIIIWSGTEDTIPQRWVLCSGGTSPSGRPVPDLRGKFILGASSGLGNIGVSSGEENVILSESNIPVHNHNGSISSGSGSNNHSHSISYSDDNASGSGVAETTGSTSGTTGSTDSGGLHSNHSVNITPYGSLSPSAHNNMPPYYALAYIMKDR